MINEQLVNMSKMQLRNCLAYLKDKYNVIQDINALEEKGLKMQITEDYVRNIDLEKVDNLYYIKLADANGGNQRDNRKGKDI
jgi:hypothetical protein